MCDFYIYSFLLVLAKSLLVVALAQLLQSIDA
jgi:hypothetical protein